MGNLALRFKYHSTYPENSPARYSLDKRKSSALMTTSILPTSVSYLVLSLTMFRLCLQELTGLSGCTLFIGNRVRSQLCRA